MMATVVIGMLVGMLCGEAGLVTMYISYPHDAIVITQRWHGPFYNAVQCTSTCGGLGWVGGRAYTAQTKLRCVVAVYCGWCCDTRPPFEPHACAHSSPLPTNPYTHRMHTWIQVEPACCIHDCDIKTSMCHPVPFHCLLKCWPAAVLIKPDSSVGRLRHNGCCCSCWVAADK